MDVLDLIDLASEKLGGSVLYANDDFFAAKENLIKPAEPVWKEGLYTDDGKWMDGWETRRRRSPRLEERYDWCVIRLGMPGEIKGVVVDTAFFRGNFPSHCSIVAGEEDSVSDLASICDINWQEILPISELAGDTKNSFKIDSGERSTHVRLKIYPDGGVARLRVHGNVVPDWNSLAARKSQIDLAAAENGGNVIAASDEFFGHRQNLIMPSLARDMSDGWETRRRRGPGHDWCVIRLGSAGRLERVEIDTLYFRGNYPESFSLEGGIGDPDDIDSIEWRSLLPETKLQPHTRHLFAEQLTDLGEISHVRLNIFPDGGVSRIRLFGRVA